MLTPLLVSAFLATLGPADQVSATSPAPAPGACDAAEEHAEQACAGSGPLCRPGVRARILCELRDALRERYVFLEAKRALLGSPFDAVAHVEACASVERAIGRERDPLRFYDRVRRCLARFEDGHLLVGAAVRLPQVSLGVGFRRAGGKIVVAWREPALAELSGAEVAAALAPGAELISIDGTPAAEATADLARYVPGGSAEARKERAVDALARRDFAYPTRGAASVVVAAGGAHRTVEVPWWASPGAARHPAAVPWVGRTGIPSTDRLAWFEDGVRPRPGAAPDGAPSWAPIFAPAATAALREHTDEGGRVAVRLGAIARGGRDLCYLQILSFHTETLAAGGRRRPFAEVIDELVRDCESRRLDLVLDLRRNEGGFLDHTTAVAEALTPAGAAQPGAALVLRATERNEAVYRERAAKAPAAPFGPRRILDAIGGARGDGRPFTPAFVGEPLRPRPSVGGYSGRVVALTGPGCMSACERLVALLHASGRAVLVGGATEGAGGSQQETPALGARWTDGASLLTVSIPNAAFGVARRAPGPVLQVVAGPPPATAAGGGGAASPRAGELPFERFFEAYAIENRPVEPDVRYETRPEDVTGSGRGWLDRVDAILFGGGDVAPLAAR